MVPTLRLFPPLYRLVICEDTFQEICGSWHSRFPIYISRVWQRYKSSYHHRTTRWHTQYWIELTYKMMHFRLIFVPTSLNEGGTISSTNFSCSQFWRSIYLLQRTVSRIIRNSVKRRKCNAFSNFVFFQESSGVESFSEYCGSYSLFGSIFLKKKITQALF